MKVDNILKVVYSDDQVKLESQKIELSLISEATEAMKEVLSVYNDQIWNQLERLPNTVSEVLSEAKGKLQKAGKAQGIAIEKARKVSEMSKELGVAMPKDIESIFKNNDYDELRDAYMSGIDKLIGKIKK